MTIFSSSSPPSSSSSPSPTATTEPVTSADRIMSAGTLYLVAIQIASRLLTFVGNQILLRYLSPSLLGLAIQLELLSVTILYTSRESLRVALQRQPAVKTSNPRSQNERDAREGAQTATQQTVNLAYLTMVVGLGAAGFFGYGYLRKSGSEVLQARDFWLAIRLYGLATAIELASEPCFVVVQQHALYKVRARAETGAAIVRCVAACGTAIGMRRLRMPISVLPFAVGQVCYAATLLFSYLLAVLPFSRAQAFSLLPRNVVRVNDVASPPSKHWLGMFPKALLSLTATFYTQSLFKLLLTQGDSLILSFVADLKSQGAFALASNYGGLLSRLLFQPVEESSRNVFGRLLTPAASGGPSPSAEPTDQDKATPAAKEKTAQALTHLTSTLRLYTVFSLPIVALVPHVFPLLITNLIGSRWSSSATTSLLSAYVYYLPFLAINGVLDAFVTSVASPAQLRNQSVVMLVVTVLYGLAASVLMSEQGTSIFGVGFGLGPAGLVWANMLNMTLRIAYSIRFFDDWVQQNTEGGREYAIQLKWQSLPHLGFQIVTSMVTGYLLAVVHTDPSGSKKSIFGVRGLDAQDLGYLIAGALVLASSMIFFEYEFLLSTLSTVLPKRLASKVAPYMPKQKKT